MTNIMPFWKKLLTGSVMLMTLLLFSLAMVPDDAEAKRIGGGGSFGSRGSQSYSAPKPAPAQRSATQDQSAPSPVAAAPARPGFMGGMLGGIGGFLMGGLLGAMLFGNMDGGFGLLDLLLLGGIAFFVFRLLKNRAVQVPQGQPAGAFRQGVDIPQTPNTAAFPQGEPSAADPVTQGLRQIIAMDPTFREDQFMDGARRAFDLLQQAWSNWQVDNLRPFVTDRMWGILQAQDRDRINTGRKDVVENIQYRVAEISETWQEAGQDWITVHYVVQMLEYATDSQGHVVEGSRQHPVTVEEYWTFTREVGSRNPNWLLSAIQQPGEVPSATV